MDRNKVICLFDVDGTLTKPRQVIEGKTFSFLVEKVKRNCVLGLVGGSDYCKILEQIGGEENIKEFDYVFSENGIVARKNCEIIGTNSILSFLGEEKLQKFINFCLYYLSTITLPAKRGTFIEYRTGLINICPVGRSCTQSERDEFARYDQANNVRAQFVKELYKKFPDYDLKFSIGGQISIDAFPVGWDKSFCLQYLEDIPTKYFFGDKTDQGGNDYEIHCHEKVISHSVTGPDHTLKLLTDLFKIE